MIRSTTLAVATVLVGLSGAAFAQSGPATHDSVGTNAAGSKSGVVGKGDSMEAAPSTTGTAVAPGARMAPGSNGMVTGDPTVAPKPSNPTPAR
ncbi:hypothetical protein [Methylobacterium sp. Leaf108]|uniref:hypothetical protein n=1 Tax=Methylobacterium sp. Leaf108 TaxID=1736256 RepID=UPI0006FD372C|nr:hypothetical protein [Methylobacterium sp. Leaf108]KQP52604.1 hypothetical protein ASF39_06735 [Methylobacterium sp. Leaf108]